MTLAEVAAADLDLAAGGRLAQADTAVQADDVRDSTACPGRVAPPRARAAAPAAPAADVALASRGDAGRGQEIKAASTAADRCRPRPGRGRSTPLFLWPTGLAVGLALKELRYGRRSSDSPPRTCKVLFGSPAPGRLAGTGFGTAGGGSITDAYGRGQLAGRSCADRLAARLSSRPPRRASGRSAPRLFADDEDLRRHTQPTASATGTSSTPRARRSGGSRPRSPTPCAASASPSTRRTSTPATSWSSSTPRRSASPATSSAPSATGATAAIRAGSGRGRWARCSSAAPRRSSARRSRGCCRATAWPASSSAS